MCRATGAADNRRMDDSEVERPATDQGDDCAEATPAHAVTGGSRFGRRGFLRVLGVGALAVIPLPVLPELLRVSSQAEGQTEPVGGHQQAARTRDGRIRQWTMIIDLRSCDGCQSAASRPSAPPPASRATSRPSRWSGCEVFEAELPGGGTQFIPTPCQQCQNPPCVNVCPVGATFSTPEGTVLIDQERCIGCRICMAACPYDRRFFNWGDAPVPPEAMLADYSPEHQVPAKKGTVMKCDFCPDMARTGTLPYCVQGCPNGAIYYGDLEEDVATNGEVIVSVSRFLSENDAYRLKEDMGTKPRVYYIPGHGEAVGRDAFTPDRLPTEWPWMERAAGAATWQR